MSVDRKNLKKYVNFQNTSAAFRGIMNSYKKKIKLSREVNKEVLLRRIYSKIQEIEKDERENDFIIGEVRRNAQINQEILYSFGTKVLNHLNEVRKFNVNRKLDKNKLLGINNDKNKSVKKINLVDDNLHLLKNLNKKKENKFILLPKIIIKSYQSKDINKSSGLKNKSKENSIENIKNKRIEEIPKNKRKKFNNKYTYNYSSFIKNKSIGNNSSSIYSLTPIKKNENSNDSIMFVNEPLITERNSKKNPRIDDEYINYLRTMGNQFSETEKKQEKYFHKNKYGVDAFKLKYNYLTKKFFN